MKKFTLFFFSIVLIILSSCNLNSNCTNTELTPIAKVAVPDTAQVNEYFPINIAFVVYNGCGKLGSIKTAKQADTLYFAAYANYEGCECPAIVDTITTVYNVKAGLPGKYYLMFYTLGTTKYIFDSIYISPAVK